MTALAITATPTRRDQLHKLPEWPAVSVGFLLLALVSPDVLRAWNPGLRGYFSATLVLPADIGIAVLLVLCAVPLVRSWRSLGPGSLGWLVVTGALTLALPFNPSGAGLLRLFHLLGAAVLAAALAGLWRSAVRDWIVGCACAIAAAESALAVAERINGGPIGLGPWFEADVKAQRFGSTVLPNGTFAHPYVLAAFALAVVLMALAVALAPTTARPLRWAVAAAVAGVPLGLTGCRDALLGLIGLGLCLLVHVWRSDRRRPMGAVLAVVAVGLAIPAVASMGLWIGRAATTTSASPGDGRGSLAHQAMTLIEQYPLTGVGPGRYNYALEQRFGIAPGSDADLAVHDLPLLAGVEGGVLALVVMTAAILWIGWRALRAGPLALGAFLVMVPFALFDQLLYVGVRGPVACGLWLGVVDAMIATSRREAGAVLLTSHVPLAEPGVRPGTDVVSAADPC